MSKKKQHRRHVNLRKIYRKYKALYWPKNDDDPELINRIEKLNNELFKYKDQLIKLTKRKITIDKDGLLISEQI